MTLTPEQIENIKEKHPDFDFDKWVEWKKYIDEELNQPSKLVQEYLSREIGEGC
jgi:hypothetical protein